MKRIEACGNVFWESNLAIYGDNLLKMPSPPPSHAPVILLEDLSYTIQESHYSVAQKGSKKQGYIKMQDYVEIKREDSEARCSCISC